MKVVEPTLTRGACLLVVVSLAASVEAQQQPRFGATVARVRVDVIVTDRDGRFVEDLGPDDFVLYEDGVPQLILGLQVVDLAAGEVRDVGAGVAGEPGAGEARNLAFVERPGLATDEGAEAARQVGDSAASDFGAMIFLIDGPSINPTTRRHFGEAWAELLESTESFHVPRAAYMVNSTGGLEQVVPLTYDVESLLRAADAIHDAPTYGNAIRERLVEIIQDMENELPGVDHKVRAYEFDERARSLNTLEMLTRLCQALMSRSGRTALVWVSTGLKLSQGGPYAALLAAKVGAERAQAMFLPDDEEEEDQAQQAEDDTAVLADAEFLYFSPDPEIIERQEELHEAANSANVSIYAVDPTPLNELRGIGFDLQAGKSSSSQLLGSLDVQGSLDELRDTLREAAQATGGEALIHWGDLGLALGRIEEHTSRFYLLTYEPPPPVGDGEYHEIEVEVQRPGLTVRERGGYVDLPVVERRAQTVAAALALPGMIEAGDTSARAFRMFEGAGQPMIELTVALGTAAPRGAVIAGPGIPWREVHVVALTRGGEIAGEIHQDVEEPGEAIGAQDAAVGEASAVRPRPSVWVYDWTLPPGDYDVRIVVRDEASGRLTAAQLDVTAPEPTTDWGTSDLMLAVTDGTQPPAPLIGDEVFAGERLHAYVEVSGGSEPSLSGELLSADHSASVGQLPAMVLDLGEDGIHRGSLWLEGVPAGSYVLRVTVTDTPAGREKVFNAPVRILPGGVTKSADDQAGDSGTV